MLMSEMRFEYGVPRLSLCGPRLDQFVHSRVIEAEGSETPCRHIRAQHFS